MRPLMSAHTSLVDDIGTSANKSSSVGSSEDAVNLAQRHFLLTALERHPACQVSFEDLRLQEAYKLLQTSSHIWLPQICTDESSFGPQLFPAPPATTGANANDNNNATATALANIGRARVDMHLAAACVRTSALPLGKGMLGLGCLVASLPPHLSIYPLCLRGKVMAGGGAASGAPSGGGAGGAGGLPMHLDLARGSLAESTLSVGRTGGAGEMPGAASDHQGNATALAIVTAVVAGGTAGALKVIFFCLNLRGK